MLRIFGFLSFLLGQIIWGLAPQSPTPTQSTKDEIPSPQPSANQPSPIQKSQDSPPPKTHSTTLSNPPKVSSKDAKRTWVLSGFGLGVSNKSSKATDHFKRLYSTFLFNVQVGGITMWDRYFGLQYYYNLDFSTSDLLKNQQNCQECSNVLTRIASSSLNVDSVMNFYNSDRFGVGFTTGFGVAFDIVSYKGLSANSSQTNGVSSLAFGFDLRANLGLRLIFGKNFALSFNYAFPFWSHSIRTLSNHHNAFIFATRFIYSRF